MASRRKGRILAFQALYCWEAARIPPAGLMNFSWLESEPADRASPLDEGMTAFARLLFSGTVENIAAIDRMIRKHLHNWSFSRVGRVDLAILRMSVYTLMFQSDVAPSIVIDEAIGIAKEFGTDDSFRFINGVLDSIRKTLQNNPEASCPPQN